VVSTDGQGKRGERDVIHRQQIAARWAAARRAQMRNRMLLAGGAIITVVAVTLALVLVKVKARGGGPPADGPAGAALARVVKDLTSVPASILDTVGAGIFTRTGQLVWRFRPGGAAALNHPSLARAAAAQRQHLGQR
jgi:hypothetical protein